MLDAGMTYAVISSELQLSPRQIKKIADKKVNELPNAFAGAYY